MRIVSSVTRTVVPCPKRSDAKMNDEYSPENSFADTALENSPSSIPPVDSIDNSALTNPIDSFFRDFDVAPVDITSAETP